MKTLDWLTLTSLLTTLALTGHAADKDVERKHLLVDADAAVEVFKKADTSFEDTFKKAAGFAVFPNVGKGGFIMGGAHGNGVVSEKGRLVGYASLTQVTVGVQLGLQELSEIIFFETTNSLATFKKGGYTLSAQVGTVVITEGASRNAHYVDGIMVFTKAKQGLMAEVSVGGQKFTFEPIKK